LRDREALVRVVRTCELGEMQRPRKTVDPGLGRPGRGVSGLEAQFAVGGVAERLVLGVAAAAEHNRAPGWKLERNTLGVHDGERAGDLEGTVRPNLDRHVGHSPTLDEPAGARIPAR